MTRLNIYAPICGTGYGVAAMGFLRGLKEAFPADRFSLWPVGGHPDCSAEDAPLVRACMEHARDAHLSAPCVKIWHQHDMALRVGKGPLVGFPIFELDAFTPQEEAQLKSCDFLLATSKWGCEILDRVDREKCRLNGSKAVPLAVDSAVFAVDGPSLWPFAGEQKPGTFVILNCGKWEIRKGHNSLPAVLNEAFRADDDFLLVMCPSNPFLTPEEDKAWKDWYRSQLGDRVVFAERLPHQSQLAALMRCADVGFFPHRAEGWNLELLEMMSLGKPVVATHYSAPTAYLTAENSLTVTPGGLEPAFDGKWFFGQGSWARLGLKEISAFAGHLRSLYDRKKAGERLVNHAGIETARRLSWANAARCLVGAVLGEGSS